jgi:hypothetical protein
MVDSYDLIFNDDCALQLANNILKILTIGSHDAVQGSSST